MHIQPMKKNIFLTIAFAGFFATQAQAQLVITTNLSTVSVSGSADDYVTGEQAGYIDGNVYSLTAIPLQVAEAPYEKDASIASATAGSRAELSLDIAQITHGYRIWGDASSSANTEMNSLNDNDATANGGALVDLAFTLTSDYSGAFTSNLFYATGTGESEVELINTSTGTVFSQVVSEDVFNLDFSGNFLGGNYTFFIGALSVAFDGDVASASVAYDLQLRAVPVPATLPLFLSGIALLGFKTLFVRNAF